MLTENWLFKFLIIYFFASRIFQERTAMHLRIDLSLSFAYIHHFTSAVKTPIVPHCHKVESAIHRE